MIDGDEIEAGGKGGEVELEGIGGDGAGEDGLAEGGGEEEGGGFVGGERGVIHVIDVIDVITG